MEHTLRRREEDPITRILLVDDSKLWRLAVLSILKAAPDFQIVSEASDGLEAVEKSVTLRPDIVLLDIQMPFLNGIEAAKRIRRASPESRIIFLTQINDPEVRSVALGTGAEAYVLKSAAACDLLRTIEESLVSDTQTGDPDSELPGETKAP